AEAKAAGFAIGYVSPRMVTKVPDTVMVIDPDAVNGGAWATGSDKPDHHDTGFNWKRDLPELLPEGPDNTCFGCSVKVADIRNAVPGDPSPRAAGATLEARRGIEVGHIFKLGTKYSDAFDFAILDQDQKRRAIIMGCYGIGVSRTMAACVEMSHDDNGIIWPTPVAPYHVLITLIKPEDEATRSAAKSIADSLSAAGVDVLIDDRKERPGVKFKDADLIGIPVRITIGPKTLEQGGAELKHRRDPDRPGITPMDDVPGACMSLLLG
ncbi:MAG TPA: hypothetical protein ENK11_04815, partial [Phycisphaerales bacterium]|nr:hypothetical protein [Phycisphaerales bacterium]